MSSSWADLLGTLHALAQAQASLTESIKLNPALREPRDVLEAIRALLAHPRVQDSPAPRSAGGEKQKARSHRQFFQRIFTPVRILK